MIEGSEELKAYIYEASQFPRVDSIMEESNTYHAVYMNPPKLTNWTKTHGGPYYVEVGKNIEIQYHTKANITIKTKPSNTTNSTTNITEISQTVEEDVIR